MTTTTSEREARELLAQIEGGEHGQRIRLGTYGMSYVSTDKAIRAIVAALTHEQREVPPGLYDLDPYVLPQQEAPSEQREGECPVCGLAWGEHRFGYAAFSCKAKPQPEAPGAVAWTSKSSIDSLADDCGTLIASKGRSDYRNIPVYVGTPPAPVDVRVRWREWLKHALQQWPEAEAALIATVGAMGPLADITQADIDWAKAALLDGQQAGVDDVRFAVPPSVAQKVCAALAPCDNMPLSEREAVAWGFYDRQGHLRIQKSSTRRYANRTMFPLYTTPQPGDGWRPISEAPKDGTPMIGWRFYPVAIRWRPDLDPQYPWDAMTLDSHPSTTFIKNGFKESDISLSHWMPLPAAPSAKGV